MKQRGFTLIEVIIAVTIAGFLLAAALPSAGAWIRNTRIRTAAESMSNGLMQARNEAVRRNQPVSFYLVSESDPVAMSDSCALSSTGAGWVVAVASPANKCATDRDSFIALRPPGNSAGGLSVSTTGGATTVTFNGYGQVSNVAAINCIKVSNPSDTSTRTLAIGVHAGGQVRMCDAGVSDANDPRLCLTPAQPGVGCN
jgi:type IV fimbrial biogenesis protein FimT